MSACDECRNDFDAMSRLVESLPDDMKTSNCVLKELLPDLIADYAKRLTLAEGEDA